MGLGEPIRLGGFKILKGLRGLSIQCNPDQIHPFLLYLRELSREKINLPYLTFSQQGGLVAFHVLADARALPPPLPAHDCFSQCKGKHDTDITVLSLFPHRNNPAVLSRLIKTIARQGVGTQGFASSPSAISVSLYRKSLEKLTYALFGPFVFSSYRTPSDWKLAQKGKEQLFKEVVASYQEKRPKIYGLECWRGATAFHMILRDDSLRPLEKVGSLLARSSARLILITVIPLAESGNYLTTLCFSGLSEGSALSLETELSSEVEGFHRTSTTVLSLTGPHFGDRHGLALELIKALAKDGISPLSLGCTVASMSLAVCQRQAERAISAITAKFETPTIVQKE